MYGLNQTTVTFKFNIYNAIESYSKSSGELSVNTNLEELAKGDTQEMMGTGRREPLMSRGQSLGSAIRSFKSQLPQIKPVPQAVEEDPSQGQGDRPVPIKLMESSTPL